MALPRSYWLAIGSLPLIVVGALGPWAQVTKARIDGPQDEIVLALAISAAVVLIAFAGFHRRSLALAPLLAGAAAAVLTGRDVQDTGDISAHVNERLATVDWGLYVTVLGSICLVLASMVMVVETGRNVTEPAASAGGVGGRWPRRVVGRRLLSRPSRAAAKDCYSASGSPSKRRAFFAEARGLTPLLGVNVGNEVFAVATNDEGVGRTLFIDTWRKDMSVLDRTVGTLEDLGLRSPEAATFIDVGANIGTTTVMALRRHAFQSAVALEPSPENFRLLQMNLLANELEDRVTVLPLAASDREAVVRLDVAPRRMNKGSHRIVSLDAGEVPGTIAVPAVTLDGLVTRGVIEPAKTGLLWMDVQGHEAKVLLGAASLMNHGVPLALTIWPDKKQARRGIRRWRVDGDDRATVLDRLTSSYTDVFVLRRVVTRHPVEALPSLVDSFKGSCGVLLYRRQSRSAASSRPGTVFAEFWEHPGSDWTLVHGASEISLSAETMEALCRRLTSTSGWQLYNHILELDPDERWLELDDDDAELIHGAAVLALDHKESLSATARDELERIRNRW